MKTVLETTQGVTLSVEQYNNFGNTFHVYHAAVDWVKYDAIHKAYCPLNPYYIQGNVKTTQCNCGLEALHSNLAAILEAELP